MKRLEWNEEKNTLLKLEREVSFEEAQVAIERGGLLDLVRHPNTKKYPNQHYFVIDIRGYAYLVPFVEDDEKVFLKTIIPSRKATKKYLVKGGVK